MARGVAIFLVLATHFALVYFRAPEQDAWRLMLIGIGMIATPTFVMLNGVLLGVLYRSSRDFGRLRPKLVDRGLFLLLIGHFLIGVAQYRDVLVPGISRSTDAIGIAMVLGSFLVPRLNGRTRLTLAALLYTCGWIAVYGWIPQTPSAEHLKTFVVGRLTSIEFPVGSFPVVPWVAVSLASSVLGERLAVMYRQGAVTRMVRDLAWLGGSAVVMGVGLKLAALRLGLSPASGPVWRLVRLSQKYPPAPVYLLFYGGLGLLLLLACLIADEQQWWRRGLRWAETCGEVSLFVFLAHFYLFWLGVYHLGPGGPALGLVYFSASVALLMVCARVWQRHRLNRCFTIGYEAMLRRVAPLVTVADTLPQHHRTRGTPGR